MIVVLNFITNRRRQSCINNINYSDCFETLLISNNYIHCQAYVIHGRTVYYYTINIFQMIIFFLYYSPCPNLEGMKDALFYNL